MPASFKSLPETLDWYRQSANWLVGLSAGALAISGGYIKDLAAVEPVLKVLFALAGVAFFLAVLCGVFFYYWLAYYGTTLERQQGMATVLHPNWASQREQLRERLGAAKASAEGFYRALVWAFGIGAGAMAILALTALATGVGGEKQLRQVVLNPRTGEVWPILEAAPGEPARPPNQGRHPVAISLLAAGLALFGTGLFMLGWTSRKVAGALATILGILSLSGGGAIFSVKGNLKVPITVRWPTPGAAERPESLFHLEPLARIGPFASARHDTDDPALRTKPLIAIQVQEVTKALEKLADTKELRCVILVGSADKRELGGRVAAVYGSNTGLAQARSMWVKSRMEDASGRLRETPFMTVIAGPQHIGDHVTNEDLALDRDVAVYGCRQR